MTSQDPSIIYDIPETIQKRMRFLEEQDARDRQDGTPRAERLRQIPPETGILLALLAANSPDGELLEIGTSAGYSSLWLSLAAMQRGGKLQTYEILTEKVKLAQETFKEAQLEEWVTSTHGDASELIPESAKIAFCFLDTDKEVYPEYYQLVVPKLVDGGMLVADNVISHADELISFVSTAKKDTNVDAVVLPIGKGLLLVRKVER
jgi:predicted O-methyltransferase YrrM